MSAHDPSSAVTDPRSENPRLLSWAGGGLFGLGLIAAALVFLQDGVADNSRMVLNAALLLAVGYPLLLHARALQKLALLERRLHDLERQAAQGDFAAGGGRG